MKKYIASVSFGKDSLAMVLRLIEENYPLDEVVFYDTGMEFQAIYDTRDKIQPLLKQKNIKYVELSPKEPFLYKMFIRPVRSQRTGQIHKYGYGWCGGPCRWGTTEKLSIINKYCGKETIQYVGIAADEVVRIKKERRDTKRLPLVDWNMTEADCLKYCYEHGYYWYENNVRLYDVLSRVSCWCCRNKNQKELIAIHDNLPTYWEKLKGIESRLGNMKKNKSLDELIKDAEQKHKVKPR